MSTGNFYCHNNTGSIYAFGSSKYYTEEDVQEGIIEAEQVGDYDEVRTMDDAEWAKDRCREVLGEKGWDRAEGSGSGDRDFCINFLMGKDEDVCHHGVEYRVSVKAGYRCGYYEGANFDFEISIEEYCNNYYNGCYDEVPSLKDVVSAMEAREGRPRRNTEERELFDARVLLRMLSETVRSMTDEAEAAFRDACEDEVCVSAVFSNGEVWYSRVS